MISLGLRLTIAGGKDALARLIVIVVAVALGAAMLLVTLSGINAVGAQNQRYAWLETGYQPPATSSGGATSDPLWWQLTGESFADKIIGRVDLAATGPRSPVPPGLPRLPEPGEYYVSPAMAALLRATPSAQLGARFPGHEAGTIGPDALPAPDSLVIVIGHSAHEMSTNPRATQVNGIARVSPADCRGDCGPFGINANGVILVLSVAAAALLFPLFIFTGSATRLSAARREQRFAAMRLVGATPRQISVISAVESTVAAAAGVAIAFGLFFLVRPFVAEIPFTGERFFPSDLSLTLVDVVLVAVGVPVAAAVAARVALRRVHISPLGVTRRVTPRPPRAWRLVPLFAGLGELGYFVFAGSPRTTNAQAWAYFPGFVLIMIGLVVAGPWLTLAGSRIMATRTSRPATLIASRRLSDDPQAGFRAVSGLVLALFVTSVAVGAITTFTAERGAPSSTSDAAGTLMNDFYHPVASGLPETLATPLPSSVLNEIESIPGVEGVAQIHRAPNAQPNGPGISPHTGLISCAELARIPAFGKCPDGAQAATITAWDAVRALSDGQSAAATVWPAADVPLATLRSERLQSIVVRTDGSTAAIEQARTAVELAYPHERTPDTIRGRRAESDRLLAQYRQLAQVVILTSLPIAGCSLAVSVAAGVSDRKRPFSLLRLTGVSLATLRTVVALESAVPLLVAAVVSIGAGFLAADLFLTSQLGYTVKPPGPGYYLMVLAGLVASLCVIASTLPLLRRLTGPEVARND